MSQVGLIFAVIGGVGFALLLLSFLGSELGGHFEFGHADAGVEAGADADADGSSLSWLNFKVVTAGVVGLGGAGVLADYYGAPLWLSILSSAVGFAVMAAFVQVAILKPMARMQATSLLSRESYANRPARVILPISPGSFGEVEFHDANGAYVRQMAWTDDAETLPTGTSVVIYDVNADGVRVAPLNL